MHEAVQQWLGSEVSKISVKGTRVLEIGSLDINGSPRPYFAGCGYYFGIDKVDGPGVDRVVDAKDFRPGALFDICVCTEVLEHDPEPGLIVNAAWDALKPHGFFFLSCAAPPRKPHGMLGANELAAGEHYQNIEPEWLLGRLKGFWHLWQLIYGGGFPHPGQGGDLFAICSKLP